MSRRTLLIIVALPIALFLAIQLLPIGRPQPNPPVLAEPDWDSPQTRALAQRACFDCHSNETTWPIYTRVAPVSWLITHDVADGRQHLNFSEWGVGRTADESRRAKVADESRKEISRGAMPPGIYLVLHPDAKLSEAEKQQLIAGLLASLK
jgi:hypothetical protein